MKKIIATFVLVFLSICGVTVSAQERRVYSMDFDWEFSRDSMFSTVEHVDLPHDFQISQPWVAPSPDEKADNSDAAANIKSRLSARGFKEMGDGWYRRVIDGRNFSRGKQRILLDFEGIMLVGDVFLNGKLIGGTDYGYVGFEIDITNHLRYDADNILVVKTSTMGEKNSRWYTGGGLIRSVNLITTPTDLYFNRHPLYITTRDNRMVNIQADVTIRTSTRAAVARTKIYDPYGVLVAEGSDSLRRNNPSFSQEAKLSEVEIANPLLWDTEHPQLYKAVIELLRTDGSVADRVEEDFGIRTVEIGADYGLKLNGRKVLLQGFAVHHSLGALGAAAYPRAIEQTLRQMKSFGINHVRTSHNPYSRDFVRLCDRLGVLVVDELYDKWTQQYAGGRRPWQQLWQYDVPEWVRRDRNSPSVVLWSLGNELQQVAGQPFDDWGVTAYKLQRTLVQRYDSTRLTTVAMHPRYRNWQTDSLPCDLAMNTDVQSYNYRYMYFPGDSRRFPWMKFYQSEASVADMGKNFFGMNSERVIGLAYWGAIDYLGESHGWPAKGSAGGVFDISLEPKPKAWFMKSFFTSEPLVRIAVEERPATDEVWNDIKSGSAVLTESWNHPSGSTLSIYTYTNCDEVELFLNGKSLGRKQNPSDPSHRNQILWKNIPYEVGVLEAVGYNHGSKGRNTSEHNPLARHRIETTGKAVRLIAKAECADWLADGRDLQFVRVTAVDAKGRRVLSADDQLSFSVDGNAQIVAVTNGDICSEESYVGNSRRLWNGSAVVILKSKEKTSGTTLSVSAKGFKTCKIRF